MYRRSTGPSWCWLCQLLVRPAAADEPTTAIIPVQQPKAWERRGGAVVVDFAKDRFASSAASTVIIGNTGIAQASLSDDEP